MKTKTKAGREGNIKICEADCESNESLLLCDGVSSCLEYLKEAINFSAVIRS